MKVQAARRLFVGILVAILVSAPLAGETKEGFGTIKLAATLAQARPPDVALTATRIAVRSWSEQRKSPEDWQMIVELERQLLANDPELQLVTESPQTLIELSAGDAAEEQADGVWTNAAIIEMRRLGER